jgi:hypothetical protein
VLSNVLFVANELDDEVYHAVIECMTMYRAFKLKGQKLTKKRFERGCKIQIITYLIPLRKAEIFMW